MKRVFLAILAGIFLSGCGVKLVRESAWDNLQLELQSLKQKQPKSVIVTLRESDKGKCFGSGEDKDNWISFDIVEDNNLAFLNEEYIWQFSTAIKLTDGDQKIQGVVGYFGPVYTYQIDIKRDYHFGVYQPQKVLHSEIKELLNNKECELSFFN